jgi:hypothetical protein
VAEYLREDNGAVKHMLEKEHRCNLKIIEDEEYDQDEFSFKEISGGGAREEEA